MFFQANLSACGWASEYFCTCFFLTQIILPSFANTFAKIHKLSSEVFDFFFRVGFFSSFCFIQRVEKKKAKVLKLCLPESLNKFSYFSLSCFFFSSSISYLSRNFRQSGWEKCIKFAIKKKKRKTRGWAK